MGKSSKVVAKEFVALGKLLENLRGKIISSFVTELGKSSVNIEKAQNVADKFFNFFLEYLLKGGENKEYFKKAFFDLASTVSFHKFIHVVLALRRSVLNTAVSGGIPIDTVAPAVQIFDDIVAEAGKSGLSSKNESKKQAFAEVERLWGDSWLLSFSNDPGEAIKKDAEEIVEGVVEEKISTVIFFLPFRYDSLESVGEIITALSILGKDIWVVGEDESVIKLTKSFDSVAHYYNLEEAIEALLKGKGVEIEIVPVSEEGYEVSQEGNFTVLYVREVLNVKELDKMARDVEITLSNSPFFVLQVGGEARGDKEFMNILASLIARLHTKALKIVFIDTPPTLALAVAKAGVPPKKIVSYHRFEEAINDLAS